LEEDGVSVERVFGYILVFILFFLGIILALASSVENAATRLGGALISIASALIILYFLQRKKPVEMVQRVEISGPIKAQEIQCPYCSAPLDLKLMKVVGGIPTIQCTYCGRSFEVTEKPKW